MPSDRFYSPGTLTKGSEVILEDQEFHHLTNVMRLKEGECLELVNGNGALAQATVTNVEKKRARLSINNVHIDSQPSYEIILAQAMPRQNRLDFILEKGTELGMTQLWLFPGQHSERKEITQQQLERYQTQIIAAMKQCGRLFLPKIVAKPSLLKWEPVNYALLYGDVASNALSLDKWHKQQEQGVVFCVGPESGFTDKEHEALRSLHATGVKLSNNILRTDTAALSALSILGLK